MPNIIKIKFPFPVLRPSWNIIWHFQPKKNKFLLYRSIVLFVASCSQLSICKITLRSTWIRQTWNYLAYMKYFLEHILTIGFQFWEPPRSALHWSNFDFLSLTPLLNTLLWSHLLSFLIWSWDKNRKNRKTGWNCQWLEEIRLWNCVEIYKDSNLLPNLDFTTLHCTFIWRCQSSFVRLD